MPMLCPLLPFATRSMCTFLASTHRRLGFPPPTIQGRTCAFACTNPLWSPCNSQSLCHSKCSHHPGRSCRCLCCANLGTYQWVFPLYYDVLWSHSISNHSRILPFNGHNFLFSMQMVDSCLNLLLWWHVFALNWLMPCIHVTLNHQLDWSYLLSHNVL